MPWVLKIPSDCILDTVLRWLILPPRYYIVGIMRFVDLCKVDHFDCEMINFDYQLFNYERYICSFSFQWCISSSQNINVNVILTEMGIVKKIWSLILAIFLVIKKLIKRWRLVLNKPESLESCLSVRWRYSFNFCPSKSLNQLTVCCMYICSRGSIPSLRKLEGYLRLSAVSYVRVSKYVQ